jgi:hypothetical protein
MRRYLVLLTVLLVVAGCDSVESESGDAGPETTLTDDTETTTPPGEETEIPSENPSTTVGDGSSGRLPSLSLQPVHDVDPVVVSTVLGDFEFVTYEVPPGVDFGLVAATRFGLVALDGATLRWSADGVVWEDTGIRAGGALADGDDLIVHHRGRASRLAWVDGRWVEVTQLVGVGAADMAFGSTGAIAVNGTAMWYSHDGVRFVFADVAPHPDRLDHDGSPVRSDTSYAGPCAAALVDGVGGSPAIGPILAVDDGFVALTASHPYDWDKSPVCSPLPWFSADGNVWDVVRDGSGFGNGAVVREVVAKDGRFVAVGGVGGEGAVWVSDDALSWERLPGLPLAHAIAAGELGWVLVEGEGEITEMWVSADALTWEGPHVVPMTRGTAAFVGIDAVFGAGLAEPWPSVDIAIHIGRLQD